MLESVWNVDATAHVQQNGVKHDVLSFQLSVTESFVLFIGSLKLVSFFCVCVRPLLRAEAVTQPEKNVQVWCSHNT